MQIDPNQFKESQRQSWDSVSEGWQKWWKTIVRTVVKAPAARVILYIHSNVRS